MNKEKLHSPPRPPRPTLPKDAPWVELEKITKRLDSLIVAIKGIPSGAFPSIPTVAIEWGFVTGGSKDKLVDIHKDWPKNGWQGFLICLPESRQTRIIDSNDTNSISPTGDFSIDPAPGNLYYLLVPEASRVSTKPLLGVGMLKWELLIEQRGVDGDAVPANTCVAVEAYTVPASHLLTIGGGFCSCNISCIQRLCLVGTPGLLGDYYFDVLGSIVMGPLTAKAVEANNLLTVYFFNNADRPADMCLSLSGILTREV